MQIYVENYQTTEAISQIADNAEESTFILEYKSDINFYYDVLNRSLPIQLKEKLQEKLQFLKRQVWDFFLIDINKVEKSLRKREAYNHLTNIPEKKKILFHEDKLEGVT
uniref:Uncharacterized protein n=1 Tax=Micrurus paraensis TaxID=1970185 RepID=A0A2D4K9F4_9SAUR